MPNGTECLQEAAKDGFRHAIVPEANRPKKQVEGLNVIGVTRLSEAREAV